VSLDCGRVGELRQRAESKSHRMQPTARFLPARADLGNPWQPVANVGEITLRDREPPTHGAAIYAAFAALGRSCGSC
jgi:hypothetical protein